MSHVSCHGPFVSKISPGSSQISPYQSPGLTAISATVVRVISLASNRRQLMSAEGIDGFALPGAILQLAARSLTMWAIARGKRKYEVSVLITMPVTTATALAMQTRAA